MLEIYVHALALSTLSNSPSRTEEDKRLERFSYYLRFFFFTDNVFDHKLL